MKDALVILGLILLTWLVIIVVAIYGFLMLMVYPLMIYSVWFQDFLEETEELKYSPHMYIDYGNGGDLWY